MNANNAVRNRMWFDIGCFGLVAIITPLMVYGLYNAVVAARTSASRSSDM